MKSQPSFVVERQGIKAPRCCCCLDVRTGTVLIGLFNLVIHAASLVVATQVLLHPSSFKQDHPAYYGDHRPPTDNFIGMTIAVLTFLITVMLIYGTVLRKHTLILPFFCMQIFDLVLFVLGSAGAVSYGPELKFALQSNVNFVYHNEVKNMNMSNFMFSLVALCMIVIIFKSYMMSCVWECYCHTKNQLQNSSTPTVYYFPGAEDTEALLPNYEDAVKDKPPPYSAE